MILTDINNNLNYNVYNLLVSSYTKNLYMNFFQNCKKNAIILDIGIGNGYAIVKNEKIIKQKNLKIFGVDIDEFSLQKCQENINNNDLQNNIKIINKDFFKLEVSDYQDFINAKLFDLVFFSNSYSVIPNITDFIYHSKNYIHNNGNIITSTTLYNNYNNIKNFMKSNIKKILFNIDFGRIITHQMISEEINNIGFKIKSKKLVHKKTIPLWGEIKVYCLVIKP